MRAETLSVRGRQVHLWRGGEGPPLVLLHGGGADAQRHWSPIWDRLAERYGVIAPDLPGCGGSQAMARSTLPSLVAWLDGLVGALEIGAVRIAGHEFGACLARAYAASHPHRCDALVLINGGALPSTPERLLARLGLGGRLGAYPARMLSRGRTPQREPTAHTLVFWTQGDHPTPGAARRLAAQLPRAAFRIMPGKGRLPQVEAPRETADILLAFLG
ncbi:MAG: 2-hydroxy-6-oxo-6-phenylhexa-2,4-dienoate hydrolase [Caulobacteraceae bacterium]|nr:2-hydroxy-6-oxo-6-phenylhexa-2,4-dienoate hydrolase [Caulobacteraceae bacterium]